jgi:hypothetical protein
MPVQSAIIARRQFIESRVHWSVGNRREYGSNGIMMERFLSERIVPSWRLAAVFPVAAVAVRTRLDGGVQCIDFVLRWHLRGTATAMSFPHHTTGPAVAVRCTVTTSGGLGVAGRSAVDVLCTAFERRRLATTDADDAYDSRQQDEGHAGQPCD